MFEPSNTYFLLVGQTESTLTPPETAPLWVEYGVYGAMVLAIALVFWRGLRQRPGEKTRQETPEFEAPAEDLRTPEEIEAAARKAFRIPEVLIGGSTAVGDEEETIEPTTTVRLAHPSAAPEPTRASGVRPADGGPESAPDTPPVAVPPPPEPPDPAVVEEPAGPVAEQAGKTLREGLARTHDGFVKKLSKLFGSAKTIDDDLLAELEETLFTADIGVRTSQKLVEMVYERLEKRDLKDPEKVWALIRKNVEEMLLVDSASFDLDRAKPLVVMVVGVNGSGKTTTIGKLAHQYVNIGRKVVLAAGDTFRAAAVEQLEVWGQRVGVSVIRGREGQDPASVIFDACKQAEQQGADICIADTAGRLQAKKELMAELGKVHRAIGKAVPGAPHEVWLVLDSTNGQNAISQAKEFRQAVDVTGIVLTKLDGTAKGGVVIGICDEMKLPIRYIGIGEKVEDLRAFEPRLFADALFETE